MMKASIQAGAGTGKTTRVVRLLLDRVLGTDTEPSRLLALTFTVRAANEMRDRLGTWLARLVDGQPIVELGGGIEVFGDAERALARGRRALADLDRMEIGTIHSFAAHLLRQYPVEAGVSPGFEEDEGVAKAALFRELWPRWIERRLAAPEGGGVIGGYLDRIEPAEIRAFADALCTEGVPLLGGLERAEDPAWRARLRNGAQECRDLLAQCPPASTETHRRAIDVLRYMLEVLEADAVTSTMRRRQRLLDIAWPAGRAWSAGKQVHARLKTLVRDGLDCDDCAMAEIVEWLRPFVEEFRREYGRSGFVSFDGLLVRAASVLRDHGDIRRHLKERFRLILVDEFQDTDPLQGEILLYLAERADQCAEEWRHVEVEPGKLIIVGDEKQSIYLFRGADLEAYQEITRRLTGGREDAVERLGINYRSRPELVRFVNAIGRRAMRRPEYAAIAPSERSGAGGRIEMILFPDLAAMEVRAAEGRAIAEWIAAEIDAGRARAGHVAVLLRTLAHAQHYTDALRARGIDFVIEGEKRFHAAPEVIDATNLLRVITDPADQLALVGLLRSPLGAVADRDLVVLREAGALDVFELRRVPSGLSAVRRLYETILRLHETSRRVPARDLIDATLDALPVLEVVRATPRGEQAVANVRKLLEELLSERGRTLTGALSEWRRRSRNADEEGEAALADDELDAVRLLSIHKAKGLEFPVVVLPDLHREPPQPGVRPVLRDWFHGTVGFRCGQVCDQRWIEAARRYRAVEEDEAHRVLYVALTRARDTLLLTGGGRQHGLLGTILSSLEAEGLALGAGDEQVLRGNEFEVRVRLCDGKGESGAARVPELGGPGVVDLVAERERWVERERTCRRTERSSTVSHPSRARSHGSGSGDDDDDDDAEDYGEGDGLDPTWPRRAGATTGGRSVGARCHDVLATMDLAHPEAVAVDDSVGRILTSFFQSEPFREIQRAERIERELPFVITFGDTVWSGRIDVVYRYGGRWIVGDYKSDRSENAERYATQARVYAEAAKLALGLSAPPEFRLIYLRSGRAVPT